MTDAGTARFSRQSATRCTPQRAVRSPGSRAPARCRQAAAARTRLPAEALTRLSLQPSESWDKHRSHTACVYTGAGAQPGEPLSRQPLRGPSHRILLAELRGSRLAQQQRGSGQAGRCAEWLLLKMNVMSMHTTSLRVSLPSPRPHWSVLQLFGDRGRRYASCLSPRRSDLTPRTAIFLSY